MSTRNSAITARTALLIAVLPFVILAIVQWPLVPAAWSGDYAQYVLHAEAVLKGTGYTNTGYLYTSLNPIVGPAAEPPGFPLTLAAVFLVTGASVSVAKMVAFASGIVFLVLAWMKLADERLAPLTRAAATPLTERQDAKWLATGAVLLTGVALECSFATRAPLSDLGFCALVWAVIVAADVRGTWSWTRTAAIAACGLGALAYRLAGLPLIPAMVIVAWLRRRELGIKGFIPPIVWSIAAFAGNRMLQSTSAVTSTIRREQGGTPATGLGSNALHYVMLASGNFRAYLGSVGEDLLYPFPWNRADDVYHAVALIAIAVAAVLMARRRIRGLTVWFAAGYVAMLLLAPFREPRYLWPLAPLIAWLMLAGARAIAGVRWRITGRTCAAAAAVLSVLALVQHFEAAPLPTLVDRPDARALFAKLASEARVRPVRALFYNPRVMVLESGVPTMPAFAAPDDATLQEIHAHEITDVVLGDAGTSLHDAASIAGVVSRHPESFSGPDSVGSFAIYQVRPMTPEGTSAP